MMTTQVKPAYRKPVHSEGAKADRAVRTIRASFIEARGTCLINRPDIRTQPDSLSLPTREFAKREETIYGMSAANTAILVRDDIASFGGVRLRLIPPYLSAADRAEDPDIYDAQFFLKLNRASCADAPDPDPSDNRFKSREDFWTIVRLREISGPDSVWGRDC